MSDDICSTWRPDLAGVEDAHDALPTGKNSKNATSRLTSRPNAVRKVTTT
uniref:Uncharacterized protein n=1 Tax=Moniliophthora roreri TaxID=221103 RepID=A0A0W0FVC9_MONRR